jgi:hypothetical protein
VELGKYNLEPCQFRKVVLPILEGFKGTLRVERLRLEKEALVKTDCR